MMAKVLLKIGLVNLNYYNSAAIQNFFIQRKFIELLITITLELLELICGPRKVSGNTD